MNKVNKLRDKHISAKYPVYRNSVSLKQWRVKRGSLLIRKQLAKLLEDKNVEIHINLLQKDKILPILVNYGPRYHKDEDLSNIINRTSPLQLYPVVKWLNHTITLDDDLNIQCKPYLLRHVQDTSISDYALSTLFRIRPLQSDDLSLSYELLTPFFRTGKTIGSAYCFSVLEWDEHRMVDISVNQAQLHYHLNPASIIQVQTTQPWKFLHNYTYRAFYSRITKLSTAIPYERIIILSRHTSERTEYLGNYSTVNPLELQLDLLHFDSNMIAVTYLLINTLDVVNGEYYRSVISEFVRIVAEINEYDENLLTELTTLRELTAILARQMTNNSFIGDPDKISKIYLLLRQTAIGSIFGAAQADGTSITQLPQYAIIDTDILSSQDTTILMLSLSLALGMLSESKKQNYTIVIEDRRLIRSLNRIDIQRLFNNIHQIYPGPKYLLFTRSGQNPVFRDQPLLEISDEVILQLGKTESFLASIDWLTRQQVEDSGNLEPQLLV